MDIVLSPLPSLLLRYSFPLSQTQHTPPSVSHSPHFRLPLSLPWCVQEDMKKALAEVKEGRHASEELRDAVLRMQQEQSAQRVQLERVIEAMQRMAEQMGRLQEMQAAAAAAAPAAAVMNRDVSQADVGLTEEGNSSGLVHAAADRGDE